MRGEFSRTRYAAAARLVAAERGLMEVSYAAVARMVGTSPSAVQRQFATTHELRLAVTSEWVAQLATLGDALGPGSPGTVWQLVHRWFVAQARWSVPFEVVRRPPSIPGDSGWDELRRLVTAALERWRALIQKTIRDVPSSQWRGGAELDGLAPRLFLATCGAAVTGQVLGEDCAIAAAAAYCLGELGRVARSDSLPSQALARLDVAVLQALSARPGFARVEEERAIAQLVRPRWGTVPEAQRSWDDVLAEAQRELAEHRRTHSEEYDDL